MVDRVVKVLPQEQVTAISLYAGWMLSFIWCFSCALDLSNRRDKATPET
jgi:hypothetical protein